MSYPCQADLVCGRTGESAQTKSRGIPGAVPVQRRAVFVKLKKHIALSLTSPGLISHGSFVEIVCFFEFQAVINDLPDGSSGFPCTKIRPLGYKLLAAERMF